MIFSRRAIKSSFAAALALSIAPAWADDEKTEFSTRVTAIDPEWEAEDWRKGMLKLHPAMYTWQSDQHLTLLAEEPAMGRTAIAVARGHYDGDSLGDDTTEPTRISMDAAKEIAPGVLAVQYQWEYGFDENVSFYGIVTTVNDSFVPFNANCEQDDPDHPDQYSLEKCLRGMLTLLMMVRGDEATKGARLLLPEPPAPINVAGWDSTYLKDGRTLANTGSFNGLRKAYLHVTPPLDLPMEQAATALKQFSDSIIDDDDNDDKDPGTYRVVGSEQDPWIRRDFPEAYDGPSIQMAGVQKTPDGKISFIGIRCPNAGWQKTCAYGVEQAKQQIKSGQMEARRARYIAARQTPVPANGIKTDEILGVYGTSAFDGNSFVVRGDLFLKDGTVYSDTGEAPNLIVAAESRHKNPDEWGTWTRSGDTLSVKWGDGESDVIDATDENLWVGGSADTKLEGRYETVSSGGNVSMGTSFVSRSSYTFFPDGRFSNDRSNSFSVGGFLPSNIGPSQIAAGGGHSSTGEAKYVIDGYMISFHYPNGEIERKAFSVLSADINNQKREFVLLDGVPYTLDTGN